MYWRERLTLDGHQPQQKRRCVGEERTGKQQPKCNVPAHEGDQKEGRQKGDPKKEWRRRSKRRRSRAACGAVAARPKAQAAVQGHPERRAAAQLEKVKAKSSITTGMAELQCGSSREKLKRGSPRREEVSAEKGEVEMEVDRAQKERKEEKREKPKPELKSSSRRRGKQAKAKEEQRIREESICKE